MRMMRIAPLIALAAFAFIIGCGRSQSTGLQMPEAPKTPGDPTELIGSTWANTTTGVTITFKDAATIDVSNQRMRQPMRGQYTIKDGVLTINAVFQTLAGTWDGQELILNGTPMTRQ